MEYIIEWSKSKEHSSIQGQAVPHSEEQEIRQDKFYSKFGFTMDKTRYIKLDLKK